MKKAPFILSLIILVSSSLNAEPSVQEYAKVHFYGDSLLDAQSTIADAFIQDRFGNNTWGLTQEIGKIGAPYTSATTTDIEEVRSILSNYLVEDYLTSTAGPFVYPIRVVEAVEDLNPDEVNVVYAYAAALTGNNFVNDLADEAMNPFPPIVEEGCERPGIPLDSTSRSSCVPGLLKQMALYLDDSGDSDYSNDLFFLLAGANDIDRGVILSVMQDEDDFATAIGMATEAAGNVVEAVRILVEDTSASEGNIVVVDMPDLGKTPVGNDDPKFSEVLTSLAKTYNGALSAGLLDFSEVQIFSSFEFLNEVVGNPSAYGFTDVENACTERGMAPRCEGYLFWDNKHTTSEGHRKFAEAIFDEISS